MLDARADEMRDDEFCKGISNSASGAQVLPEPSQTPHRHLSAKRTWHSLASLTHVALQLKALYYTSYLWRHTVKRMEAAGLIHGKGKRCVYKKIIRSILGRGSVKYDNSALISTCEVRTSCMDKAVQAWAELSQEVLERHSHVVSSIPLLH